jgi:DNA-directed RNA polymerase specialized sigma24 family protein
VVLVTPEQAVEQPSVEGLYRRYARDVFSVAYRLVGSRAEAEEGIGAFLEKRQPSWPR